MSPFLESCHTIFHFREWQNCTLITSSIFYSLSVVSAEQTLLSHIVGQLYANWSLNAWTADICMHRCLRLEASCNISTAALRTSETYHLIITYTIVNMEPLSGLAVATATVQFVDFTAKIISRTHAIKTSSGVVPGYEDIATTTNSLVKLSSRLDESINQQRPVEGVTQNDAEVLRIANECSLIGGKLLQVLDEKRIKDPGKWDSFRLALSSYWDSREVDSLEKKLLRLRQDLTPVLLASLR